MFYFSLKWVNIRGNIIIYLGENKIYVQLVSWPKQKRTVLLLSRFVGNHWLESYKGRALAMHKHRDWQRNLTYALDSILCT